ncbi:acetyl-CoA carboxylase carboxyltransferase subunit alpha [Intestinibacillus massiliensis]|uniref:acetyl-CoA carboxylase carboxyltransferase subunit alpha n=1 Tax=Intestinibacillus massiliensis TaxID=1871029 RepID=UPI000B35089C|nr:acetyl-CoA carboxylase carboxyltransferase subunit alpha [Intestinibacillus massiliensis]
MRIIHDPKRPTIDDYVNTLLDHFVELHGDRFYADDAAICAGIGTLAGIPVTVIGHRKGKTTEGNLAANFGMPHPEGYRKALRLAHQAEKFGRPVICIVDTPGAFCGIGAEERGQGEAIARSLAEFMNLRTPVISIVTGEGGSGGALALAVADRVLMLENAIYSVISPRGCASILWKDASRELEAAERLRITADDLLEFGVIESIINEGANVASLMRNVKRALLENIQYLQEEPLDVLLQKRYEKFRKVGVFNEI